MIDFKSVFRLFSFTLVAQVIAFAVYPLLTRLYAPDDFGIMNLYTTIGGILVLFSTMDLHSAIPLPQGEDDSAKIVRSCLMSMLSVFFVLVCCVPFGSIIETITEIDGLSHIIYMLPVYVFFMSFWQVFNFWLTRRKLFPSIASYQFSQSLANSALKVGLGFIRPSAFSFIIASAVAPVFAFVFVVRKYWGEFKKSLQGFSRNDMEYSLTNYKEFPTFSLLKNLMLQLSNGLPVMMLTPVFGLTEVGYYSSALVLGFVPIGIMANSVYQVLIGSASEKLNNHQSILPDIIQFLRYSLFAIVPLSAVLCFILPSVTEMLLGEGWGRCGEALRMMLPWCFSSFVGMALTYIPEVLLKLRTNLLFEVAQLVCRLLAIYVGIMTEDFLLTIFLFSCAAFVVRVFQVAWFVKIAREREKTISK